MLGTLQGAVGGWAARGWLSQVLSILLWRRVGRVRGDMERLVARYRAGRLWRRGPRVAVVEMVAVEGGVTRTRGARVWPGRFGWLVRAASWHAAGYGSQLAHVLRQPEMVELLRASPQAGRILLPVCRALGVEAALLRPFAEGEAAPVPVVPETQASGGEVKPRARKPRPKVDWGRHPLPRGVISWVRREKALERALAQVRGEG